MEQSIQAHLEMIRNAKNAEQRAVRERYGFIPPEYMAREYNTMEQLRARGATAIGSLFDKVKTFRSRGEAIKHLQNRETNHAGFKKPIVRPKAPFGGHVVKYHNAASGLEYSLHATKGWRITDKYDVGAAVT